MTNIHSNPMNGSGLHHLVEAASALSRLVDREASILQSAGAPPSPAASTSTASSRVSLTTPSSESSAPPSFGAREVSDDDTTLSTTCSTVLRANHIRALRAAAQAQLQAANKDDNYYEGMPPPDAPATMRSVDNNNISQRDAEPAPTQKARSANGKGPKAEKQMFPMRLHALLADPTVRDVISWLPHGKSFVVLRPDVFATRVLPRYFAPEGSNSPNARQNVNNNGGNAAPCVHKYPSFTRKLNRWGFRQVARGPDAGAFCHDLFSRDDPEACRGMVCQKSRKAVKPRGAKGDIKDAESVSSTSTRSLTSGDKRPRLSAASVSTAGSSVASFERKEVIQNKSLPFKKRRSEPHQMIDAVPAVLSQTGTRNEKAHSSISVAESDVTAPSENTSIAVANSQRQVVPVAHQPAQVPVVPALPPMAPPMTEAAARQALMLHFQQHTRTLAIRSLMENSRIAMEAAGIQFTAPNVMPHVQPLMGSNPPPRAPYQPITSHLGGVTVTAGVVAPTANLPVPRNASTPNARFAQAAKSALYKNYIQALSKP